IVFCVAGLFLLRDAMRGPRIVKVGALVLAVGAVLGLALIYTGTSRLHWNLMYAHIAVSAIAVVLLAEWWFGRISAAQEARNEQGAGWLGAKAPESVQPSGRGFKAPLYSMLAMAMVAILISFAAYYARVSWSKRFLIRNPEAAPLTMNQEG